MMPRADLGNFNKLLVTLGLAMVIAALLIPYFYLHDTDTLRITRQELGQLTGVARAALETRQRRERDLELWILIAGGVVFAGGIVSLGFGSRRMRRAQSKEDRALEIKAKREEAETRVMSSDEVEEKREEQAEESVREEKAEAPPPGGADQKRERQRTRVEENRRAITRIETAVREVFSGQGFGPYGFLADVKSVRGERQVRLDGLFQHRSRDGRNVVLELKVTRSPAMVGSHLADTALASVARYREVTSRPATGWLVVVVSREAEEASPGRLERMEERLNARLAGAAEATVIRESDIPTLADKFRGLFLAQAK